MWITISLSTKHFLFLFKKKEKKIKGLAKCSVGVLSAVLSAKNPTEHRPSPSKRHVIEIVRPLMPSLHRLNRLFPVALSTPLEPHPVE